jgi:tRNA(fMet)-specific endonuclease VapC
MTRVLLDTSAYSALRRGDDRLRAPLSAAQQVLVSPVVLGELLAGFEKGSRSAKNRAALEEFLEAPRVEVAPIDRETAERYATLHDYLRLQGRPIPSNDLWIAATAFQHGLRLLTLDAHFKRLPHIIVDHLEPRSDGR